jgi:tetratricopeptide (TPR) repeat protein
MRFGVCLWVLLSACAPVQKPKLEPSPKRPRVAPVSQPARAGVRVRTIELTLPTYRIGRPSRHPPLWRERVYPYRMQVEIARSAEKRHHRALVLQNRFLRVEVLPDLGGRVHGALLTSTKPAFDFIYRNGVIKPALIGLRGAWLSGGIEWNFPSLGHSVNTSAAVQHAIVKHANGSASVVVGATEWVRRMRWVVWITLRPNDLVLYERARLSNPGALARRAYFWVNAATHARPDTRVTFSPTRAFFAGRRVRAEPWPMFRGSDRSFLRNTKEPYEYFNATAGPLIGVYHQRLDAGTVHVSDPASRKGKKFWTWGTAHEGRLWQKQLTDKSGPYLEIQSGKLPTQLDTWMLAAHGTSRSAGHWYPVRGIGQLTSAGRRVALGLIRRKSGLSVALFATRDLPAAQLRIDAMARKKGRSKQRTPFWAGKIALKADKPFRLQLEHAPKRIALRLTDKTGKLLLAHDEGSLPKKAPSLVQWIEPEKARGADQLYRVAQQFFMAFDARRARFFLRRALDRNPSHRAALLLSARLALLAGQGKKTLALLERLSGAGGQRAEPLYLRALVELARGRLSRAKTALQKVIRLSPLYRARAARLMAEVHGRAGKLALAKRALKRALQGRSEDLDARVLLAALSGRKDPRAALATLRKLMEQDPLHPLAILVATRFGANGLVARLNRDPQYYVESALALSAVGLNGLAKWALGQYRACKRCRPHPLIAYTEALLRVRARRSPQTLSALLKKANKLVWWGQFPFRVETFAALELGKQLTATSWRVWYWRGLFLQAKQRRAEALYSLREAVRLGPKQPQALAALARVLAREKKLAAARPLFERALLLAPADHELFVAADQVLERLGDHVARKRWLSKISKQARRHPTVQVREALLSVELGRYGRALSILRKGRFTSWEIGPKEARDVYVMALHARADRRIRLRRFKGAISDIEAVMRYPENLGQGRPADPDFTFEHFKLARCHAALGRRKAAREHYRLAAAARAERSARSRCYRAKALLALGQVAKALVLLKVCGKRRR